MNLKSIFASVALLAVTGAALADEGLSRTQVVDATVRAMAAGQTDHSEAALGQVQPSASSLSREQVLSATRQALAEGKLNRNEAYDSPAYLTPALKSASVEAQLAAKAVQSRQQ